MLLYPAGHPAIAATLGRIAQITAPASLRGAAAASTCCPTACCSTTRAPARPDAALTELAVLLHSHLIGEMTIHPGGDVEAWRTFLLLLGRTPESVRADGGIARVWATMAGRHVELREIDYAEVLRERAGGDPVDLEDASSPTACRAARSSSTRPASASCSASPATASSWPT